MRMNIFTSSGVRTLVCMFAVGVLGGCGMLRPHDDPARFYVLTVPHNTSERIPAGVGNPLRIGLRAVELPDYLSTKSMVVRTGPNEVRFADFDRWAEPLDQGIVRVVKEVLSSSSNVASVILTSHGDDTLDCDVAIRIGSCEGVRKVDGKSSLRFAATWEVRAIGTNSMPTKRGGFSADAVAWSGRDYGELATLMSEAIGRAGLELLADLPTNTLPSISITHP